MASAITKRLKTFAAYTEKPELAQGRFDKWASRLRQVGRRIDFWHSSRTLAERVRAQGSFYEGCDETSLTAAAAHLQRLLHTHGIREDLAVQSFALVREVATRVVGQRHYDVQLQGGWGLLHGFACEMQTGEGKTLTATLAACAAALAGAKVHIVTVNDYLARRDAENMGPIYQALGLSVGVVTHQQSFEERQRAYASAVTYCTNKELTFDYLRDRITLGGQSSRLHLQLEELAGDAARSQRLLLQGLEFAIVDELDSVLIDEARTPLIISRPDLENDNPHTYEVALAVADALRAGDHFTVDQQQRLVTLTEQGQAAIERLTQLTARLDKGWEHPARREEFVRQALTARDLYQRNHQYIVRDGQVEIVDENTGRSMPDRSWEHGLHQAIEAKEKCEITPGKSPLQKISYQRFFRRYAHLSGMTGTAREVAGELSAVYGLTTVRVPTHRPSKRKHLEPRFFVTAKDKWAALVDRVDRVHGTGRPILIGTRTVHTSELVAELLELYGMHPQVLNARQDQEEAEIVSRAGAAGTITVATDMAGRGTDILVSEDVVQQGGLHIISVELHESARIERQLFGRCARQGEPGSHENLVSLEDEVVIRHAGRLARRVSQRWSKTGAPLPGWLLQLLVRHTQRVAQHRQRRIRKQLLDQDERIESLLGFAGDRESRTESHSRTGTPQRTSPAAESMGVEL